MRDKFTPTANGAPWHGWPKCHLTSQAMRSSSEGVYHYNVNFQQELFVIFQQIYLTISSRSICDFQPDAIVFLSNPCPIIALSCPWVSHWILFKMDLSKCCSYMDLSRLLDEFVKNNIWISLICYRDFSCFYMDLSKLLIGCVKVVTWICFLFCSTFAKQNQADIWPIFQSLLKLLRRTKGVEWVKVLNALGLLCLWQCFKQ